jgi:hypothetical protein
MAPHTQDRIWLMIICSEIITLIAGQLADHVLFLPELPYRAGLFCISARLKMGIKALKNKKAHTSSTGMRF